MNDLIFVHNNLCLLWKYFSTYNKEETNCRIF